MLALSGALNLGQRGKLAVGRRKAPGSPKSGPTRGWGWICGLPSLALPEMAETRRRGRRMPRNRARCGCC